jgi:hypothetical protein
VLLKWPVSKKEGRVTPCAPSVLQESPYFTGQIVDAARTE